MKRFNKTMAALAAGAILAFGVAGTAAAHQGPGGAMAHPKAVERMAERLELTDTQRQQIKAVMDTHGAELAALRERIREQRQAVAEHGRNGFNEAGARAEAEVLGELVAQAAVLMTRVRADIGEVLSDEQRTKLEQSKQRHQQRKHHRQRARD